MCVCVYMCVECVCIERKKREMEGGREEGREGEKEGGRKEREGCERCVYMCVRMGEGGWE